MKTEVNCATCNEVISFDRGPQCYDNFGKREIITSGLCPRCRNLNFLYWDSFVMPKTKKIIFAFFATDSCAKLKLRSEKDDKEKLKDHKNWLRLMQSFASNSNH